MGARHRTGNEGSARPELYLLFAGRHGDAARGVGSLIATFASQEEARAAFRQARLNLSDIEGWAELSVVSAGGRPKKVSWFGATGHRSTKPLTSLLDADRPAPVAPRRVSFARRRAARDRGENMHQSSLM